MKPTILFGTPLWVLDAGLTTEEIEKFKDLSNQCEQRGSGVKKSNNSFAFHTPENFAGAFQQLPAANKIAAIFRDCLKDYSFQVKSVNISYWSIISRRYSYNSKHNHGDSLLSSALYVSVPDNSGEIKFHDPRPGKLMSNMIGMDHKNIQHQSVKVSPQTGMIIVFPSFLEHEVTMTMSNEARIVYSFNVSPIEAKLN